MLQFALFLFLFCLFVFNLGFGAFGRECLFVANVKVTYILAFVCKEITIPRYFQGG